MADLQPITYSNKGPLWARVLVTFFEYCTGRFWMERSYSKCMDKHDKQTETDPNYPFFSTALSHLKTDIEITQGRLEDIPENGPLLVVANHPFGITDGLILNQIMHDRRTDYFILTNQVLFKAERMVPYLIPIDDTETSEGTSINQRSILRSMKHIKNGGAICIFPAGRLARPTGWFKPFEDLEWQALVSHFVQRVKCGDDKKPPTVVPIFFEGENSTLFRIFSMSKLFTLTRSLVINECKNKQNRKIGVRIGKPLKITKKHIDMDMKELASWMRSETLALGKKK